MDVDTFLGKEPCIEEIDGFLWAIRGDGRTTPEIEAALTTRRTELLKGRRVPAETKLKREWTYRLGKPAVQPLQPRVF